MKKVSLLFATLALCASLSAASGGWIGSGSVTGFNIMDSNVGRVCQVRIGSGAVYAFKVNDQGTQAMVDFITKAIQSGINVNVYQDAAVTLTFTPVSAPTVTNQVAIGIGY